eukprot:15483848-Alexandrium_andersonii.AAC.1
MAVVLARSPPRQPLRLVPPPCHGSPEARVKTRKQVIPSSASETASVLEPSLLHVCCALIGGGPGC